MRSPAVDNYIFGFNEEEKLIMEVLRDVVFHFVPSVEESFKFKCPFYSYKGLLCYINWEKKTKKVILGFVEGFLFEDKYQLLNTNTNQVKKIYFNSADEIDEEKLAYYFNQAVKINETKKKNFMRTTKLPPRKKL